jgi:hypothetical protein
MWGKDAVFDFPQCFLVCTISRYRNEGDLKFLISASGETWAMTDLHCGVQFATPCKSTILTLVNILQLESVYLYRHVCRILLV